MKNRRVFVVLAMLLAGGCAQPGSKVPAMTHWDYSPPLRGDGMHIALINAAGEQNALQLYCHEPSKDLVLQVAPSGIAGGASEQTLSFAYDGGPPELQHWQADMYEGRFLDFSLAREEPGFDAVIRALKSHRSVALEIATSGKVVRRDTFSLDRAAEMIDRVLAVCGHPVPA